MNRRNFLRGMGAALGVGAIGAVVEPQTTSAALHSTTEGGIALTGADIRVDLTAGNGLEMQQVGRDVWKAYEDGFRAGVRLDGNGLTMYSVDDAADFAMRVIHWNPYEDPAFIARLAELEGA